MQIVLRLGVAVLAFVAGSGAVFVAEAAIERLAFGEVAAVEDELYDTDRSVAEYTLRTPIDFHVKGLRLGSTANELIKALGKPRRIERLADYPDLSVYHYNGLKISIGEYDGSKTVDSIEIVSASETFDGLTVGSSLEDVRRRLGAEHYGHEGTVGYNAIIMDGYIAFSHDGTKITAITNGYDGC